MREQLIKQVEIIPIEFIVRNIATGSLTKRLEFQREQFDKPLLEYCLKMMNLKILISKEHIYTFGWATEKKLKKLIDDFENK